MTPSPFRQMSLPFPYHATPEEIGALLVLAREKRGLSRLAAARLLETDHSNLRKAEMNSERHLVYAVGMLSRYAQIDTNRASRARATVEVTIPMVLNDLVDDLREPARASLRDLVVIQLAKVDGAVVDSSRPDVVHVQKDDSLFIVSLDRRSVTVRRQNQVISRLRVKPADSDEDIVAVIMSNINPPPPANI